MRACWGLNSQARGVEILTGRELDEEKAKVGPEPELCTPVGDERREQAGVGRGAACERVALALVEDDAGEPHLQQRRDHPVPQISRAGAQRHCNPSCAGGILNIRVAGGGCGPSGVARTGSREGGPELGAAAGVVVQCIVRHEGLDLDAADVRGDQADWHFAAQLFVQIAPEKVARRAARVCASVLCVL